ncbi:MAG: tyrosine--tRNA ligase [Candidatus Levybacteria bacterium RIFCSPHIGHO2_02_FULL_40_18]|nr:MAG: tyrosine--tRNA ligase [Candidatus Levybacteria bacterium RIFCSPHIGHO2_01_FULL_40_58]OGH26808.1 MAG: tyrosine--tRNA ligase [Candidatus Levybacteria bacterium RIFCSPHIGHO2_02_FULL_40_18]OGH31743.1 MAG: tyrosine--tRNA ligase [Candidatus Levybacteria bacterium RIFCSPHIGHO2_12_FULL_40_31]OGH40643.1 MAG: tyrosine--tRNA ligase [Candidatus Levybacteria bacterium RIFCSPLOWO2_01_FULL_40_64]OGH48815.1 MAG: tyrosine--tRNA ligase [Candidatus Levybacteria bacterium RIFCSPLOWO2_02_FULL_41_11]OGH53362
MDKITELLTRGVETIYPSRDVLEKVLRSDKKLRIYNGIDPTGKLHLGHLSVLRKLRQFQDLGHEIIILIGDFTARIGDPTDKLATRKKLSKMQIEENAANYKELIGKVLDLKRANIRFLHNEEWSNKLKPEDMLELASYFTVSQLLERDMFQQRIKENKEIYVHEFLYPIFQAYDSVTMNVDMEIGGNDQTFNMLAGRTLMRKLKNKEKFVLTTKLLTDPTGKKMGKTEGNIIALEENPVDMFGQIMSWPDEITISGFTLLTDVPTSKIDEIARELESGANPIGLKKRLAFEIVKELNGEESAKHAQEYFEKTVQKKELPEDIPTFEMKADEHLVITDLLVRAGLVGSKSEAKRLVEQGAVEVDSDVVDSPTEEIIPEDNMLIKCGKRNFIRIKIS